MPCAGGRATPSCRDARAARALRERLRERGVRTEVLDGAQALCELAAHPDVDAVMAAIVGAAGLAPCLAAARAGKRLLLANKEALVVGGALLHAARCATAARRCCRSTASTRRSSSACPKTARPGAQRIDHIVLTASGGPFRDARPGDACAA